MKRLIFALLYDRGQFMLSRNFRLQGVGGIDWLFNNYDFAAVSHGLDELMVVDVTRGKRDAAAFSRTVAQIAERCFIPVTAGGGIRSVDDAAVLLRHGADKVLVNSLFADDPAGCLAISDFFGRQCLVASIDYREDDRGLRRVWVEYGARETNSSLPEWLAHVVAHGAGEIVLQSLARDGTGMGLDLSVTSALGPRPEVPLILLGGVGRGEHITAGLRNPDVDAVATANLFNFISDSFLTVRSEILTEGVEVAQWCAEDFRGLAGLLSDKAS